MLTGTITMGTIESKSGAIFSNCTTVESHTHNYRGTTSVTLEHDKYDHPVITKEFNNQKVMLYKACGIPKENVNYETEFVNKTKETYLNIVGKVENKELDFESNINVHMLIDAEIYDQYEVHIDNGLVTVILHEIQNEAPVLVDCGRK